MRSIVLFFSMLVLAVAASHAVNTPPSLSEGEIALKQYLEAGAVTSATIAAFDHVHRNWTVLKWDTKTLKRIDGPTEKPEISLGRGEQLLTFVVNTDPLVFTADRSATAEASIDTLATLQQLASGLGGILIGHEVVNGAVLAPQLGATSPRAAGRPLSTRSRAFPR
jgi:hypothetical protein